MEEERLKEIEEKAKVMAKKCMETSKRISKLIKGKEGIEWCTKMSNLTRFAEIDNNALVLAGLIEQELTRDELILSTAMLIRQEAERSSKDRIMKGDIAFR